MFGAAAQTPITPNTRLAAPQVAKVLSSHTEVDALVSAQTLLAPYALQPTFQAYIRYDVAQDDGRRWE